MTIGERVFELIKSDKKFSQRGMAGALGVPPTTVNHWCKGGGSVPAEYIKPMADYFGVSCEYLLTGENFLPLKLSEEDAEWLEVVHQLPDDVKLVVLKMLKGYLKN